MYYFYNANPKKIRTEDCVTRAIFVATGGSLKYEAVSSLLQLTADEFKCPKLCVCCYHHLLEDILHYECRECLKGESVKDVAKRYRGEKVLIRIEGHLTCSIYGTVVDIWDCSNEKADCFWIIK